MLERRVIQVLDEWRELERRIAAGVRADELDGLARRISELRAEYHRLSRRTDGDGVDTARPADPPEAEGDRAVA